MIVYINGKAESLPKGTTIDALLKELGYFKAVVVWVNQQKLLQREYSQILKEADEVKIVRLLGGG